MDLNKLLLTAVCATCSTAVFASITDIKTANNQAAIQYTSTQVNYKETDSNGNTLDTENGAVPGVAVLFTTMADWWLGNDYLQVEYSRNSGSTTYIGAPLNGNAPFGSISAQDSAVLIDYDLRYGKGFILQDNVMLTPYVEIGHHEWDRGVNAGETYSNKYYGVGALGQYSPVRKLVFTANAFVGRTYHATIDLSPDPYGILPSGSSDLGSSNLYKIGLGADYALTPNIHLDAGVDYNQFRYGNGIFGNTIYGEPNSSTRYTTVKLGLGYAF